MSPLTTSLRALAAFALSFVLMAATWGAPSVLAQDAPPPAQQQPASQPLSAEQLDQLVAPIALYPDNLLAQILTASTYPLEAVMAARWSAGNPNVKGQQLEDAMQQQPWDPSIKALTAVPQVLAMMSDKLDWTQMLGDAYLSQPDDIAAAVQRLRLKAQAAGNLQASSQERIRRVPAPQPIIINGQPEPDYIVIEPVDPTILYVPIYDPFVVYGPWAYPAYRPFYWYPPGYVAVGVIGFGAPFVVGAALWAHYNWESRHVDINVVNYNRFNRTNLINSAANQTWQHNPLHRGNIPYNNPALQQKFGKTATGNPIVNPALKTNLTNPTNPKGGTTLNNNAITNLNKSGGLNKNTDLNKTGNLNKNVDLNKGGSLNKNTDLKVDKNTKLNVNGNVNINNINKPAPKTLDRRVNVDTGPKVNTNAVVHTNPNAVIHANPNPPPVNRGANVQNVGRNIGGGGGGGGGGGTRTTRRSSGTDRKPGRAAGAFGCCGSTRSRRGGRGAWPDTAAHSRAFSMRPP